MTKGQVKGRVEQATGKIKEVAGKATGDRALEAEGRVDKNVGKVRSTASDIKDDIKRSARRSTKA
jgi:uncharacterized protein YjbJ (UPF0337 family)